MNVDGHLCLYRPTGMGWQVRDVATGLVHQIRGRIILGHCSCEQLPVSKRCRHLLSLIQCQQSFRVAGLDTLLELKREGSANAR